MSHKCNCGNKNDCGCNSNLGQDFCGINPCCILIGIVILGFLVCGPRRC